MKLESLKPPPMILATLALYMALDDGCLIFLPLLASRFGAPCNGVEAQGEAMEVIYV